MTWVAVGMSVVGTATSILGGISGAKAAKKAGKAQSKIIKATEAENQRRRMLDLNQQLGGITASVAASNLLMSGSAAQYRGAYEANTKLEMGWDAQKARMDAKFARMTGAAAGQAAMFSGISSAAGYASTAVSAFGAHASANGNGTTGWYLGEKSGKG